MDDHNGGSPRSEPRGADVVIVGAGLAGLATAAEVSEAGRSVLILDQESEASIGGQAHWSLGGLFMVDTPEQRRMGIRDSAELALQDWLGSAQFDREEDAWPRRWAEAYIEFASGEMRPWLRAQGMRWFPVVGWAERGGAMAHGHGNSVPRFHLTWGTGPGVVEPFLRRVREQEERGRVHWAPRHRVSELVMRSGAAVGVRGERLADSTAQRGERSNREVVGEFELAAGAVVVTSGGIGGDIERVRAAWPQERLGEPPDHMLCGVPHHVDGRMLSVTEAAGGAVINADRMWHYCEGVENWSPIWPAHGIRILPGPSSMWFDAFGNRLPAPCLPGFDTLSTLRHILASGASYSWFILTQSIIEREFALSGSEQNPDLTSKRWLEVLRSRRGAGATPAVEAFKTHGKDFIVAEDLAELVRGMNSVPGVVPLELEKLRSQIQARDRQIGNPFSKDLQVMAIRGARAYRGDRLIRTAKPHRLLDSKHGPLIAVRLHVLTRKTLGGLHTDLDSRVLDAQGSAIPGLFAAGEVAGFGGGGYHGYNALEGTFLGGCIFSGRRAGRALASL